MIQRVKEIAIETGWSVSTDNDSGCTQFEFSKFTPAGQDFNFTVEMKDNNISQLIAVRRKNLRLYFTI